MFTLFSLAHFIGYYSKKPCTLTHTLAWPSVIFQSNHICWWCLCLNLLNVDHLKIKIFVCWLPDKRNHPEKINIQLHVLTRTQWHWQRMSSTARRDVCGTLGLGAVLLWDWTTRCDRERVGRDVAPRVSGRFFLSCLLTSGLRFFARSRANLCRSPGH